MFASFRLSALSPRMNTVPHSGNLVGLYFKGGVHPLTICVSDFDRAAPHGTGHIKAGLNYAMSLHAYVTAHQNGYMMKTCSSIPQPAPM